MDPFAELERMALNAGTNDLESDEPSPQQVVRWQKIFHYTQAQAICQIRQHRADFSRPRVSDDHWELVRTKMEGYDRETYEHKLVVDQGISHKSTTSTTMGADSASSAMFVFKLGNAQLGDLLSTPAQVRDIAKMTKCPDTFVGTGEDQEGLFCRVDATAKKNIELFLTPMRSLLQPTFVRCSLATKEFDKHSAYPTLGLDTTLPQHRLHKLDDCSAPSQAQYPVWYFFYGTLADPDTLIRLLNLEEPPALQTASISGGIIKTWGGTFKALINGPETAKVDGWAYCVKGPEHEEALRFYETAEYEVVRCRILLQNGTVQKGCTFRFANASITT